jgi:hypothetical protein
LREKARRLVRIRKIDESRMAVLRAVTGVEEVAVAAAGNDEDRFDGAGGGGGSGGAFEPGSDDALDARAIFMLLVVLRLNLV